MPLLLLALLVAPLAQVPSGPDAASSDAGTALVQSAPSGGASPAFDSGVNSPSVPSAAEAGANTGFTPSAPNGEQVGVSSDAGVSADYEQTLIAWGLARGGDVVEPAPEGKVLEDVRVAAEDVVAQSDPYPNLLNIFHARTRDDVVRREVLLTPGQPYSVALVDESVRNLRKLGLFSAVRAVTVKGRQPGTVVLLLITKDLWSLRLNSDFSAVGSLLQYLRLQGTEQNFLGRGKKVAVDFVLRLDTISLGQSYTDRRVLGSRWALSESAAVLLGRESGKPEGSRGSLSVSRPLYSLATPWSVSSSVAWNVETARQYRGADIWQLPFPDGPAVPYVYNAREVAGGVTYTRSFGQRYKWNVGMGAGAYHDAYAAPVASMLTDAQEAWFRSNYLPRAEDAAYASLSLSAYEARYEVFHDLDSYALSEDVQLGHSIGASLRYAPPVLSSSAHYAQGAVTARYRVRWAGDALTAVSVAASIRRQLGENAGWTDRRWATEFVQASPQFFGGRIVGRGVLDVNIDDLSDRISLLGGGNGLRGALVDAYSGKRLLLFNLEYRSPPLVIKTVHLGGVLFLDSGSAFNRRPSMVTSVGVGLRLLFPQFNVNPFRIDFGYVLNGDRPPVSGRFSFSAGQVTDYRPSFLDSP
ncbi:hypothetical protein DRW03_06545 [Corallococcus sp. H22C18031201]|nr:hypothetical protein DRW03_06545 [Corallococcus sp. H22C18031201]